MEREVLSFCRICAAACGIAVTVDGDRVLRVRGDGDHPASSGYTCSKGRGLADWHHAPGRLDRPRLRGVPSEWDPTLEDLARRLQDIIATDGPDAIGLYLATGVAYDAAGQVAAGQWLPSIGSGSFFTAVTVDNAPVVVAAELVTGQSLLNPVWDPTAPGLLLLFGTNPAVSHGYGTALPDPIRHLRDYRRRGGRVAVLDPRRSETAALADVHLAIRPGADVEILGALASGLLADGADLQSLAVECIPEDIAALRRALAPYTVARAAAAGGIDIATVDRLIVDVREHCGRLAIMCGTGVTMARDGVVAEWLRWVVLVLSGSLDRAGGMRFNRGVINRLRPPRAKLGSSDPKPLSGPRSRPELRRVMGQLPAVAMADEIEAGHLRALVVTGGNPITAFPEPDRMRAALRSLDVLVIIDVAESELCDLATHVLPATGQLERADLTLAELTAVRSALQSTRAVVEPVAQRRPVWWMLAALTRRMGGDALGGVDPDTLTDEAYLRGLLARSTVDADAVFAAGPHGVDVPVEYGWVRSTFLTDGRWHLAPAVMLERLAAHTAPSPGLVLVPRREMAWSNSVRYAASGVTPFVHTSAEDAADAGVSHGDRVVVTSSHGSITASVAVDDRVSRGVVSFAHGRAAHSPGSLISATDTIDPLTAMPHASGVAITITPDPSDTPAPADPSDPSDAAAL